jgi:2-dehydro-3-deoxygluconokinase
MLSGPVPAREEGVCVHSLDVVTFGEAMAMFVADRPGDLAGIDRFVKRVAGAESNVAVGLARLGLKVGWVSRLGADSFGRYIRASLTHENVDCSRVATDPGLPTGFLLKSKTANGADPLVEYFRKGSAASRLSRADFDREYFLGARHLHVTGIAPALSETAMDFTLQALEFMRTAGRSISFDPNLRPSLWPSEAVMVERINALAAKADWVLPGLEEGRRLTGLSEPHDIAGFYQDQGARLVVVKLGPKGAYLRDPTQEALVPGFPVREVVDTVGAGDGFAVGVISALLEGLSASAAVARGNRIGAFAVQVVGDMDGLPTRAQLDAAERH